MRKVIIALLASAALTVPAFAATNATSPKQPLPAQRSYMKTPQAQKLLADFNGWSANPDT